MAQQTSRRQTGLDVVRALAILMVVIIHTAGNTLSAGVGGSSWWGTLFWAALARPAVPLFFLCSGALMLGRDIPLRRLYGRNLLRIAAALLVWAFGYHLASLLGQGFTLAGLWQAARATLLFEHEFHFYYLHILILVYAFLPVTRAFVRNASRRELEYLLAFWSVTGILFPLLRHFPPFSLNYVVGNWYTMNMAYAAIGYGALGHYLRAYGASIPRKWYVLAWAAGLALTFGGAAALSLRAGALDEVFLEGMSPGPMLMAFGLFGLMANRERWPEPVKRLSGRLALSAFCVYLVHILVMRVELRLGLNLFVLPGLIAVPLSALAVFLPSCLCWEVLRHIPIVNKWLI